MTNALEHRGPDDSGVTISPDRRVAFGHRRLSIIDPSSHAHQPCATPHGSLTFNGEIFNFRELARSVGLPEERSDTVVLANLLDNHGIAALPQLRGFFAFAYWRADDGSVLIARDAIGKKPVHYIIKEGLLIFASELRALYLSGWIPLSLSAKGLDAYLSHYCVPAPHSMLEGVETLLPGHFISIKENVQIRTWWSLPDHAPIRASRTEIVQEIRRLVTRSTEDRMIADVPIGAFHSGGIDSNVVVGLMARHSGQPVSTFHVDFGDGIERNIAQEAATHFGCNHHEIQVSHADVQRLIPAFFYRMDAPTGDGLNSFIVANAVHRLRPDIKVVLSGVGGDELFLGYRKIRALAKLRGLLPLAKTLLGNLDLSRLRSTPRNNMLRALARPDRIRLLFDANERTALGMQTHDEDWIGDEDPLSALMRKDLTDYLPNMLLRDLDVTTMAHSLEARAPLLDRALVEFAWQIPLTEKSRGGSKALLAEAFSDLLPESVKRKPKTGFELPMSAWLREGSLQGFVEMLARGDMELIRDGYLRAEAVANVAHNFRSGRSHYLKPWSLIVLEYWYRSFTSNVSYEDWCSGAWQSR